MSRLSAGLRTAVTDRLYLSAIGILVVLALTVAYLFSSVLDRPLTSSPTEVTVTMASTGGLFEGSSVTYRGVKIGRVTTIRPTADGVVATAVIDGAQVPADSRVVVRSLSPVGEQYLDFQPSGEGGPYLQDGATLTARTTDLPTTLGSTVVAVSKLLGQIDDVKLKSLLGELSTGLRGTGQEIGRLLDQASLLLGDLDKAYPQTDRLLRNAGPALRTITDNRADLESFGSSAVRLAAFLKSYDPQFRRLLDRAPGQLQQLDQLVADADAVLPDFLRVSVTLGDIVERRDPAFRELLRQYAPGLRTLSDVVRDKKLFIQLIASKDDRCSYGTPRRGPRDLGARSFATDGSCPASFPHLQRGAAHAPRP
ncbi:MlaD family protein [Nocardioides fonticola]|uniref:MlaD family protein n=1 Tax=Nocardioides fonticola TaxID=450363 RepID=A0ABP7XZP6_9ACTN